VGATRRWGKLLRSAPGGKRAKLFSYFNWLSCHVQLAANKRPAEAGGAGAPGDEITAVTGSLRLWSGMKQPPPETVAQITRRLRRLGCSPEIIARHAAALAKTRLIPRKRLVKVDGELRCLTPGELKKIRERDAPVMIWNRTP
jgi:hypothetical protein